VPQFTVKWPNGAEVTFEGDVTFEALQEFLDREEPPASLAGPSVAVRQVARDSGTATETAIVTKSLDPHQVDAAFAEVNARSDIERVTVLAHLARETGMPGIDQDSAQNIYRELGLPMPGNWRSTFSNAAVKGYLMSEGRGVFRPTAAGENFARLGQRRPTVTRRRRRASLTQSEGDDD